MNKKMKRKESTGAKIFLAIIMLFNVAITLILKIVNRQETLKVLKDEETLELLSLTKKNSSVDTGGMQN